MKEICSCGGNALTPKPAKFSIEDKYGSYRRKAKIDDFKKKGLL
jgi:rRNA maturation protein Nop10